MRNDNGKGLLVDIWFRLLFMGFSERREERRRQSSPWRNRIRIWWKG